MNQINTYPSLLQQTKQQPPTIFKQTQNYLTKINHHTNNKIPHPQQLLSFLISHNFSSEDCYHINQLTYRKQKLQSQIRHLSNKIQTIIKSNETVIALHQSRDEKTTMIEKLLKQRNTIELKAELQTFRTKHKFKDYLLKGVKNSLVPDKRITIKQNLRFYRLANQQYRAKIQQLKKQSDKIERHNHKLFEQRQVEEKVNLINLQGMRSRTNEAFGKNQLIMYPVSMSNPNESDAWILKIQQLKQRHLRPQQQCQKLQTYEQAKALQQSPLKHPTNRLPPSTNIYSNRFWSNNLREYRSKDKQNSASSLSRDSSPNPSIQSIYCCKSRERINLIGRNHKLSALSRVKSLGSIDSTVGSNVYSYRKIYR